MSEEEAYELSALQNAWTRFATYDLNAVLVQRRFYRLRSAVLIAGLAATVLAIVYQYVEGWSPLPPDRWPPLDDWNRGLHEDYNQTAKTIRGG